MDNRYVQQFKKGSLELILLSIIARGETYGYALLEALNRGGAAVLGYAREGTVYPILYRLERAGLVRSRLEKAAANGGSRKYYALTEEGAGQLRQLAGFWQSYRDCVDGFLRQWEEDVP